LYVLFAEDDTSLPDDDLLDLELSEPEFFLEFEDAPLEVHVLPEGLVPLVLGVLQLLRQLLAQPLLPLDLGLERAHLAPEVVHPVKRRQHRVRIQVFKQLAMVAVYSSH
jgi:hypothetical protein